MSSKIQIYKQAIAWQHMEYTWGDRVQERRRCKHREKTEKRQRIELGLSQSQREVNCWSPISIIKYETRLYSMKMWAWGEEGDWWEWRMFKRDFKGYFWGCYILLFHVMPREYFIYSNFSKYLAFGHINPLSCYVVILDLLFTSWMTLAN